MSLPVSHSPTRVIRNRREFLLTCGVAATSVTGGCRQQADPGPSVSAPRDDVPLRITLFGSDPDREAIEGGSNRGASTLTQQVVKNVYLWHGRSWLRKALEAGLTPLVEALWSKRRILEVYLNVAEFDEGVFGVEAASRHYFGVGPGELTASQAARLASVLPSPKTRSASQPGAQLRKRAASIADGAATIRKDGRAACFED